MTRAASFLRLVGVLLAYHAAPAAAQIPAVPLDTFVVQEVEVPRARLYHWIYRDVGPLAKNSLTPRGAAYAAGAVAFTLGLAWLDDDGIELSQDVDRGAFGGFLNVVNDAGGPAINAPVVATAALSLLTHNERLQDAAWTSLQTLIYAGVLGYAFKGMIGRGRPEWTDNTYAFFSRPSLLPFLSRGNSSYPAGHAIASYGIITPWVLYYPSYFTYALYLIPTGTSIARMALQKHWPTDLVVGAAIGISMGRWLTQRHKMEQSASRVRLSFSLGEEGSVFLVRYRLR